MVVPSDVVVVEVNVYSGREDPYIQLPRAQIHRMLQSSFGWRNPGMPTGRHPTFNNFISRILVEGLDIWFNCAFFKGLGYQGFTIYNYQPDPVKIGCGSDMGVETGLLDRLGLKIDQELRRYVQSQVKFGSFYKEEIFY
jgi:hypothetical protein